MLLPGSFPGFLSGMKGTFSAMATGAAKQNPRHSDTRTRTQRAHQLKVFIPSDPDAAHWKARKGFREGPEEASGGRVFYDRDFSACVNIMVLGLMVAFGAKRRPAGLC